MATTKAAAAKQNTTFLDVVSHIPLTSIIHIIVAVVGGVILSVHGNLSGDFLTYAGIVEGGNVGVALARGVDTNSKP